MSGLSSFHPVFLTNGDVGVKVDLLKLLAASPLLQEIILSLGVPISWLEDLNIIVPDLSLNSLALFKSLPAEPLKDKGQDDSYKELFITLGILGTSHITSTDQIKQEVISDASEVTKLVVECDWDPEYADVDSIKIDDDRSAFNNNATGDHTYSKQMNFMSDFIEEVNRELENGDTEEDDNDDISWTPNHRRIVLKKKKGFGKEGSSKKRFQNCGKCDICLQNTSFQRFYRFLKFQCFYHLIQVW